MKAFALKEVGSPDQDDLPLDLTVDNLMIKNLTKQGDSYALVIDKPLLELLRITPDTPLEVTSDGQCLILTPVRDSPEEEKFQQSLEKVHSRFGNAMKRLAE